MVNVDYNRRAPLRKSEGDDVARLAAIFHVLFEHYTHHKSPMIANVFHALRTVVGLGFTTCLTDAAYSTCYQPHLTYFLNHGRGDFQKYPDVSSLLANHIADMVFLASRSFQTLPHRPVYYQEFINNTKGLLKNVIVMEAGKEEEARQILDVLENR